MVRENGSVVLKCKAPLWKPDLGKEDLKLAVAWSTSFWYTLAEEREVSMRGGSEGPAALGGKRSGGNIDWNPPVKGLKLTDLDLAYSELWDCVNQVSKRSLIPRCGKLAAQ